MRLVMIFLGHFFLVLGLVGIPLPLLPTTPFLLLAAYFYSKGSPWFHDWLQTHPRLGPSVRAWQKHGVIRTRVKLISTLLIVISLCFPLLLGSIHVSLKIAAACVGLCVLTFIHTRPSRAPEGEAAKLVGPAPPDGSDTPKTQSTIQTLS